MKESIANFSEQLNVGPQLDQNRRGFLKSLGLSLGLGLTATIAFISVNQDSENTLKPAEASSEIINEINGSADSEHLLIAQRSEVIGAPIYSTDVPADIRLFLGSRTVSLSGCSGTKVFIEGLDAGVQFGAHCVRYDHSSNTLNTYGMQVFSGPTTGVGSMRIADDLLLYPSSDLAFIAYPEFTAEQVANEFFEQTDDFDWKTVPNGSPIYFSGYPNGFEVVPRNKNKISFVGSSIGVFTVDVFLGTDTSEARTVEALGVVMNLTQNGLGCLPGLSGTPAIYFDSSNNQHSTGALTGYATQAAGRETILDGHTYTSKQAIESQIRIEEKTGIRAMGDLVCFFALPNKGESVDVAFVNGR